MCSCAAELVAPLHSAADTWSSSLHFPNCFLNLFNIQSSRRELYQSPSEMLLFDLTGTGLPTESRDSTVSEEHKQTVGWTHCVRQQRALCTHSLMALFDSPLTNKAEFAEYFYMYALTNIWAALQFVSNSTTAVQSHLKHQIPVSHGHLWYIKSSQVHKRQNGPTNQTSLIKYVLNSPSSLFSCTCTSLQKNWKMP